MLAEAAVLAEAVRSWDWQVHLSDCRQAAVAAVETVKAV